MIFSKQYLLLGRFLITARLAGKQTVSGLLFPGGLIDVVNCPSQYFVPMPSRHATYNTLHDIRWQYNICISHVRTLYINII